MHDLNWWLMTLAFLIGLVLTFVMMIRRVTREVPVTHTVSAGVRGNVAGAATAAGSAAAAAAGAKLSGAGERVSEFVESVASIDDVPAGPYGKGSAKAGPGGTGPAGWLIKGNADSMLYHPPDSPAYEQTIAEMWFFDEETAKKAGFDKWDKNFR